MTDTAPFHPEAEVELNEAADYYDSQTDGLGGLFLDEVEHAALYASEHPEIGPIELGETRKLKVQRFPYSLMYSIEAHGILVTAVAHERRRPYYWRDRH